MEQNIFTEIMNLIEEKTDIPVLKVDIEDWLEEDNENKEIYEIYEIASKARNL